MMFSRVNEFSCLSNTLVQAGLRIESPIAFSLPERAVKIAEEQAVKADKVWQVRLFQCPRKRSTQYRVEVVACSGKIWSETFSEPNLVEAHDAFVLYDRDRDGIVQHLHVLH